MIWRPWRVRRQQKLYDLWCLDWHQWFAWWPVTLLDGRRAWLVRVRRCVKERYPGALTGQPMRLGKLYMMEYKA